jgi:hypothetical protein
MSRNTRARLERVEALARALTPEPPPWAHIDDEPRARFVYVTAALPLELHEAIEALRDDPLLPAAEALAERRSPALAAGVAQLQAIADAFERGEPVAALPKPADAIAAAREVLFGAHNIVPAPYGRANRRAAGMPPVTYDLGTIEGAAAAVLDYGAYLCWNLDRSARQLWEDDRIDAYLARYAPGEADELEPAP